MKIFKINIFLKIWYDLICKKYKYFFAVLRNKRTYYTHTRIGSRWRFLERFILVACVCKPRVCVWGCNCVCVYQRICVCVCVVVHFFKNTVCADEMKRVRKWVIILFILLWYLPSFYAMILVYNGIPIMASLIALLLAWY